MRALRCPHCTAPLDPASGSVTLCPFCGHVISGVPAFPWDPGPVDWPGRPEDAAKPRLEVGGRRWVVDGRLGRGDASDVFLAHRDHPLTEKVVLKVLRAPDDGDLLAREHRVLRRLLESRATGADYFARLLPQPIAVGPSRIDGADGPLTSVHRWRTGFTVTLDDVIQAFPDGVDPRAAVWMWKRLLELLGWVHQSGVVHAAVLAPHVLLAPEDHGAVLLGWSAAVWRHGRDRAPAVAFRATAREIYPAEVWAGAPPEPSTDLAMSARVMAQVLGGDPATGRVPHRVPAPLAALLRHAADPGAVGEDAWALQEDVVRAAAEAFGPPRFVPFVMPAPRRRGR